VPKYTDAEFASRVGRLNTNRRTMRTLAIITGVLGVVGLIAGRDWHGPLSLAFACVFLVIGEVLTPWKIKQMTAEHEAG
jgi:hypothetical protein